MTFIDKNKALTESLNSGNGYKISYFGGGKPAKRVNCVRAETWETVSHIDAGLIFVSVGGSNLADAGKELRKHISAGQRIIVCENAFHPAKTLYEAIGIDGVRISESTVFCTTIDNGGIDILSEGYPYLQFDALPMDGNIPQINGLKPIKDFGNFLARKLFTYNNASCVIAYLGYIKGCTVYSDAANDTEILALLDRNYEVINRCMCREFGYDETGQSEFAVLSRKKFTDRTIVDTVVRNACEPQRKLKKDERIIAPLLLADKYGEDTSTLINRGTRSGTHAPQSVVYVDNARGRVYAFLFRLAAVFPQYKHYIKLGVGYPCRQRRLRGLFYRFHV